MEETNTGKEVESKALPPTPTPRHSQEVRAFIHGGVAQEHKKKKKKKKKVETSFFFFYWKRLKCSIKEIRFLGLSFAHFC